MVIKYPTVYDACAGQPETLHQLSDVVSVEWAGNDALVYTQPDALGRPYKVQSSHAHTAVVSIPPGCPSMHQYAQLQAMH